MKIEEIEKDLIEVCNKVIALGWKLRQGTTCLSFNKTCCAIGAWSALDSEVYPSNVIEIAAARYGMNRNQTVHLVAGFDGVNENFFDEVNLNNPYYRVGCRLRKRFIVNED